MNDSRQLKIVVINSLVAPEGADEAAQLQADCSVDFLRPPTPQAAP